MRSRTSPGRRGSGCHRPTRASNVNAETVAASIGASSPSRDPCVERLCHLQVAVVVDAGEKLARPLQIPARHIYVTSVLEDLEDPVEARRQRV